MKITALEESADFATLDTGKLFSKLKSHKLSRKGCPNHNASFSSKTLITGARVGGHVANLTNIIDSSALVFALSSLCAASDEQYESIPDDEIALVARKFHALHRFYKERRRSPRAVSSAATPPTSSSTASRERSSTPLTSTTTITGTTPATRARARRSTTFRDKKKKKKFQKMMSRACAALSDLDLSSDDSFSSEEDERPKRKTGDFTDLYLMGKSSRHISDSDVSDDSSPESLSSRVIELENALCNQDKLLCKIFRENKKLNLEFESSFSDIASL
jgi:hypothetical protein